MKNDKIRVIIADDHPIVRTGLRIILTAYEDVELVGEAADGAEAVRLVEEKQPDVILMDLRMPVMDGLEAIRILHRRWPQVAIIILTTFNEDELMIQGLQAGACGYLLKDTDLEQLMDALHSAARGEALVQPEVMQRILMHAAQNIGSASKAQSRKVELTEREREILLYVSRGERTKEIASRLGLTERTIRAYLTNIYTKLGVDSRASAVAMAMKQNLLPPDKQHE